MKEITKKWLEYADNDFYACKVLMKKSDKNLYPNCYYHLHQAVEKYLKAYLAENNIKILKTHDLVNILNETKIKLPKELSGFIDDLNPFYNPIRYPDSFKELKEFYTKRELNNYFKLTRETIKWLHHKLIEIN